MSTIDKFIEILAGLSLIFIITSSLIRGHKKKKNTENNIVNEETEDLESSDSSSSDIL